MSDVLKNLSAMEEKALLSSIKDLKYEVFLFGSRVEKKGGDIDILIFATDSPETERFGLSLRVTADFKKICDEKIDVIVMDPNNLSQENKAFLKLIKKALII